MRLEIEQELKIALYKKIYKYVRRYASVVSSAPHHGPDAVERSDMNIICTDTELQGSTVEPNHAVLLFIAKLFFGEKQMSIHPRSHNHLTRTIYKYKVSHNIRHTCFSDYSRWYGCLCEVVFTSYACLVNNGRTIVSCVIVMRTNNIENNILLLRIERRT